MEAHHSVTTHPQILPGIADANSQYDCPNDYVWRQFSATGVASPFLPPMSLGQMKALSNHPKRLAPQPGYC